MIKKSSLKKHFLQLLFSSSILLIASHAAGSGFRFGVIGPSAEKENGESILSDAITQTNEESLDFVIVHGIKSRTETCTDKIYGQRKDLLRKANGSVIVSLAASDWTDCKNTQGRPFAMERLSRLRDLFFSDDFSFGAKKIRLMHQSSYPKFRGYSENLRWEFEKVLFATINLPANNNNYRPEAGRNSEFDDRQIANRDWLQRIFSLAKRKKLDGIVLFCDGDPLSTPSNTRGFNSPNRRDGFVETRQQIIDLSAKFSGKVLLIHSQKKPYSAPENQILWHANLGSLSIGIDWIGLAVDSSDQNLFSTIHDSDDTNDATQTSQYQSRFPKSKKPQTQ